MRARREPGPVDVGSRRRGHRGWHYATAEEEEFVLTNGSGSARLDGITAEAFVLTNGWGSAGLDGILSEGSC